MHFVDPETGVYYTIPDEDEEPETNPIYRVQPVYGRGKGETPLIRTDPGQQSGQIGSNQVMIPQQPGIRLEYVGAAETQATTPQPVHLGPNREHLSLFHARTVENKDTTCLVAQNLCKYDRCTSKWRFYHVNKPGSTTGAQPELRIRVSETRRWNSHLE